MGKITFRADDDLVDELESLDDSKSEVMRRALRSYLEREASDASDEPGEGGPEDDGFGNRVDERVRQRLDALLARRLAEGGRSEPQDVHVRISLEADDLAAGADGPGARVSARADAAGARRGTDADAPAGRADRGVDVARIDAAGDSEPFGERGRPCGQCGTTVDADHVYCPNCGEKVSRRVFCECGDEVHSDWSFCPSCGRRTPAADVLDSR